MSAGIDIRRFESLAYARRHAEAFAALTAILDAFEHGGGGTTGPPTESYTRIASAAQALLCDPQFKLDDKRFIRLTLRKRNLDALFAISAFGSTQPLLARSGMVDAERIGSAANGAQGGLRLFLAALTAGSRTGVNFPAVFEAAPVEALGTCLALLSSRVVASDPAHSRREGLTQLGRLFDRITPPDWMLDLARSAMMLCSYATNPRRHAVKPHLNGLLRRWLAARGLAERVGAPPTAAPPRPTREKPLVLVAVEVMPPDHAMFRCYAPAIRQLRERFRVEGLLVAPVAERTAELFDAVHTVSPNPNDFPATVATADALCPDVLWFPSLGMRTWTSLLANLRIAPAQVVTPGHPATSCAACADWMILGSSIALEGTPLSEKIAVLDAPGMPWAVHAALPDLPAPPHANRSRSTVAVNARTMKLNLPFLRVCADIATRCARPVDVHFFPAETGARLYHIASEIRRVLPTAHVHAAMPYADYLHQLAACDLLLCAFPFGGSNSTADALLAAVPAVAMLGPQPHERTDARALAAAGLPDSLVARTPEQYTSIAVDLLNDDAKRTALARHLADRDMRHALCGAERERFPDDFARTIMWIHANAARWTKDSTRMWTPAMRTPAP
ncbi:hypothetical protein GGQ74_003223 [Desulfobaculum xiamenense]|uniref:HMW1C N-terminal domain-containing protein n=1 Tax=Desulfobaculum xiamenense TaxID=995050 RepID=A0A846QSK1_9BACT|nr:hypothetical protein [Desulfobaculum xiamenense]NJB69512.1 hypothetical protein [Desulfobaculum xiamenense]